MQMFRRGKKSSSHAKEALSATEMKETNLDHSQRILPELFHRCLNPPFNFACMDGDLMINAGHDRDCYQRLKFSKGKPTEWSTPRAPW